MQIVMLVANLYHERDHTSRVHCMPSTHSSLHAPPSHCRVVVSTRCFSWFCWGFALDMVHAWQPHPSSCFSWSGYYSSIAGINCQGNSNYYGQIIEIKIITYLYKYLQILPKKMKNKTYRNMTCKPETMSIKEIFRNC